MKISENTKDLVEKISENSTEPLKNIFEISFLIESTFKNDKLMIFKDLIFTAKYVNGLMNVLSGRIVTGDDYMEKIFDEFNMNLQKLTGILKALSVPSDAQTEKFFDDKYFKLEQNSIINLMELIGDLTACKEFFNKNPENLSL